jgi:hypothetical protein
VRAMLRPILVAGLVGPLCASAASASGCDDFKWPIAAEQEALAVPAIPTLDAGGALSYGAAARLQLVPFAEAKLALPPERAPKFSPSYAGAFALAAPAAAGTYLVTSSAGGWIDLVQDGKLVKSTAFGEPKDCPGVRKSVKFPLAAAPATLQVSGVGEREVSVIVTPE